MHLITQSCVLFLWMHSLTFVKGRECTLEQFLNSPQYNQNFDTSGLAATYSGGRQVRVGCNVGFSGFFKLICVEGKWDTKGTICTLKPCGHPGDSQNADFQLEKGEDFVFGSQVKYTCHKGYQMVSRTNYRRCMAEGWDGNIPVCEAQQCPIIDVDSHVQVNGDIEEATFGNVVRFSCKSSSKVLFGSAEMYCDENGEWVGESPKCKEIICTAPEIEHGEVLGQTQEYKEDQFLEFQCDHLFTSIGARSSKCTKQGVRAEWSPTPLCEPITCKLQLPALKGTSYEPVHKNTFQPGDQVTVNCGEKHWIFSHQEVSVVTTCKEDGEWNIRPVCQEVTCSKRGVPHVSWRNRWPQTFKSGEWTRYRCETGYRRIDDRDDRATCTQDGWHPNPLCQVKTCPQPRYRNANMVGNDLEEYGYKEQVEFICNNGYEGRFTVTCGDNGWSGYLQCRVKKCPQPGYPNADMVGNDLEEYRYEDQVEFICKNGYEGRFTVTCGDNGWSGYLQCRERRCKKPHIDDTNFIGVVRESYRQNDRIRYACKNNLEIIVTITCEENGWNGIQSCSEVLGCGTAPIIADGDLKYARKSNNSHNEMVEYMCQAYYTMEGEPYKTCINGVWTGHLRCIQPCTVNEDDNRRHNITFKYNGSTYFTHDEIIEFRCTRGIPVGSASLLQRCNSGVIVLPTCQEF